MDHYAVIETTSEHVPGDERSQANPGHGYPAHTVTRHEFREFETREDWEKWIRDKAPLFPSTFKAIIYQEVEISRAIEIKVGDRPPPAINWDDIAEISPAHAFLVACRDLRGSTDPDAFAWLLSELADAEDAILAHARGQ